MLRFPLPHFQSPPFGLILCLRFNKFLFCCHCRSLYISHFTSHSCRAHKLFHSRQLWAPKTVGLGAAAPLVTPLVSVNVNVCRGHFNCFCLQCTSPKRKCKVAVVYRYAAVINVYSQVNRNTQVLQQPTQKTLR